MIYQNKQSSLTKIHWNQISTKYTPRFIIIAFDDIFTISYIINEEADLQRECNTRLSQCRPNLQNQESLFIFSIYDVIVHILWCGQQIDKKCFHMYTINFISFLN